MGHKHAAHPNGWRNEISATGGPSRYGGYEHPGPERWILLSGLREWRRVGAFGKREHLYSLGRMVWVLIDQGGRDERQREGVERLESGLGGSGARRMAGGQSLERSEGEETAAAGTGCQHWVGVGMEHVQRAGVQGLQRRGG